MAYIDPDGMFYGDRMELISDEARLVWPFFWVASNTVGRLELNYKKIIARAFHQFRIPPSDEKFWAWMREYRDAYLLFIYKDKSQAWGQWDVSERYLPKHKLAADKRTPAPDAKEFDLWKNGYLEWKLGQIDKPSCVNNSARLAGSGVERRGSGNGSGEEVEMEARRLSSSIIEFPKNENPPKNDDDKPKPPNPAIPRQVFASEGDELVVLISKATGEAPDRKLVEDIRQAVELRGATLRAYLDDIEPRLGRLKSKPGPGFFHDHAKKFGGYDQQPILANEIRGPCCKFGVRPDGSPCDCQTGRELVRATERIRLEKEQNAATS